MEQFFSSLAQGERLYVELNTTNSHFVVSRADGQSITLPTGLPVKADAGKLYIGLAFPGLVERYSCGMLSVVLKEGCDGESPMPIGERSMIDREIAKRRYRNGGSGFFSLGETLAATTLTQIFVFEVIANATDIDASTPVC